MQFPHRFSKDLWPCEDDHPSPFPERNAFIFACRERQDCRSNEHSHTSWNGYQQIHGVIYRGPQCSRKPYCHSYSRPVSVCEDGSRFETNPLHSSIPTEHPRDRNGFQKAYLETKNTEGKTQTTLRVRFRIHHFIFLQFGPSCRECFI